MTKGVLGSLGNDVNSLNMSEILKKNRMTPAGQGSELKETISLTDNAQSGAGAEEEDQTLEPPINVNLNTETGQQKGDETSSNDRRRRKASNKTVTSIEDIDWNVLETFVVNVPDTDYGKAAQRLSDDNKDAFDEIAKRIGVPAVHLINHILKCWRIQFKKEFEKKYPARKI